MAQNITIAGASYPNVPAIEVPKTGGGTARFLDPVGSQTYTENGTYDVSTLSQAIVNVNSMPYAFISVIHPAGSTLSISPSVTGSRIIDSTHTVFDIAANGTYTVTAMNGERTAQATATITKEGQIANVGIGLPHYIIQNGGVLSGFNYELTATRWHTTSQTLLSAPTVEDTTVTISSKTYNAKKVRLTSGTNTQGSLHFAVSGCAFLSSINLFHYTVCSVASTPAFFFASKALPVDGVWEDNNIVAFQRFSTGSTPGTTTLDISNDNNDSLYIGVITSRYVNASGTYTGIPNIVNLSIE